MHGVKDVATELARRFPTWQSRVAIVSLLAFVAASLLFYRFSPKQTVAATCAFRISNVAGVETKGDARKFDTCVEFETASTNSQRTLGLSGRSSMSRDKGMLFDFGEPAEYCMWMKDMRFSLDMIWLNSDQEIVYMIEDVTPETYPKSFCGPKDAQYVVEVNSGVVKAGDLRVGQHLRF
jgi:uncharacterized membrane protein (UPF0127 family)